jgi:hypothetical protein
MEKIEEFASGVKVLAPGLVIAIIFFAYSDIKFDEFGFLLFSSAAVIIVSLFTEGFLVLVAALYFLPDLALRALLQKPRQRSKKLTLREARSRIEPTRVAAQFVLAVLLGILAINLYQNDALYRSFGEVIASPKVSHLDAFDLSIKRVVDQDYHLIDQRSPRFFQPCPKPTLDQKPSTNCVAGVYLKIKTKQGDLYEGGIRYFPVKHELQGIYLSPACVQRIKDKLEYESLARIGGPGVYVALADIAAIEYLDIATSPCFELYYPERAKTAG